jgi:hypothetical protein
MGHSWISIAGWVILALTCLFAWIKGALPEKLGASWLLALNMSGDAVMAATYPHTPQVTMFSLDLILALGLLLLAIRYTSLWLGAAMILQSIALLGHGIRLGHEGPDTYTWMVINDLITQAMQGCLVAATAMSWWSRRKPKAPPIYYVAETPAL